MILIPAVPQRIHLQLDLSTQTDSFIDEPIKVLNLFFQLVEVWVLGHPLAGYFGKDRRIR